jgi:hypothetical protein
MQPSSFISWLLFAVGVGSLTLIGLTWLEGVITIWHPRSEASRFWQAYDKLLSTLRYISASEEKLALARFSLPTATERTSDDK